MNQEPQNLPIDSLSLATSRRSTVLVSLVITAVVVLGTGAALLVLARQSGSRLVARTGQTSEVDLKVQTSDREAPPIEFHSPDQSVLINGGLSLRRGLEFSRGTSITTLAVASPTASQTITLPNASGSICLDSGNCNYASQTGLDQANAAIATLRNRPGQAAPSASQSTSNSNQAGCSPCVALQPNTPGSSQTGNINVSGNARAGSANIQGQVTTGSLMPGTPGGVSSGVIRSQVANIVNTPGGVYNDSVQWSALGTDGFVRLVYFDNGFKDLKLVRCTDADCATSVITVIASSPNGLDYPTIAIGPSGLPYVLYHNYNSLNELRLVRCNNQDCTSITDTIIATGNLYESSLTMANDGFVRVGYTDYNNSGQLNFIRCTNVSCSTKVATTITGTNKTGSISIFFGPDGFPRLAYQDFGSRPSSDKLGLVRCLDADCTSRNINIVVVGSAIYIYYIAATVGPDGLPRIAYTNYSNPTNVNLVRCTNSDCTVNVKTIVAPAPTGGGSYLAVGGLSMGPDGLPRLAFDESGGGNKGVTYVRCQNADCTLRQTTIVEGNDYGYPSTMVLGADGFGRLAYFRSSDNTLHFARLLSDNGYNAATGSNIGTDTQRYGQIAGTQLSLQGDLQAALTVNTGSGATVLVVDTLNQRVGINQPSPAYPLDVTGDINSSSALRVGGNIVCTSAGCTGVGAGNGFVQGGNSFGALAVLGTNDNNALAVRTNGVERLRIDASGNVGIGTSSPTASLHVSAAGNGTDLFKVTDTTATSQDVFRIADGGATMLRNQTDTTAAFQVQSATGGQLFNIDSVKANITLNGQNSGALQPWATSSNALLAPRSYASAVTANGYAYMIGGYNGTANVSTVYYAKLNADGTTGVWITNPNSLPTVRSNTTSVVANGYIYVIGDSPNAVYYAKLNPDGTTGAWTTSSNPLPAVRYNATSVTANGYVYVIGGQNASFAAQSTIYYAKLSADGTTGAWTTSSNPLPALSSSAGSVTANGYVYVIGGSNGATRVSTVYYAKLKTDGTTGVWSTNANTLPAGVNFTTAVTTNGYVYILGGGSGSGAQSTVYYAKLNIDGTAGVWSTNANTLPIGLDAGNSVTANGYVYYLGGEDSSFVTHSEVYYASTSRIQLGGSLDLVGLSGGSLSEGGTGGSLTAGNTFVSGQLTVTDQASFNNSLSVDKELVAHGSSLFKNSADTTTAFQVQNATGSSILSVDTTNQRVGIGTKTPGNLLSIGALTTPDATGQIAVSTGGVNNKGIIIQAVAGQNVDLLQAQDSAGAVLASIDKVGNLTVKNATVNGTLTVNGHIITANASGTTTIAAGAAACTTPTVSVAGNDTAGTITITTGTGCAAAGILGTVSFANAYGAAPRIVISPDNLDASNLKYYTSGRTTTTFNLSTNNAPTDATTYVFNYQVLQ